MKFTTVRERQITEWNDFKKFLEEYKDIEYRKNDFSYFLTLEEEFLNLKRKGNNDLQEIGTFTETGYNSLKQTLGFGKAIEDFFTDERKVEIINEVLQHEKADNIMFITQDDVVRSIRSSRYAPCDPSKVISLLEDEFNARLQPAFNLCGILSSYFVQVDEGEDKLFAYFRLSDDPAAQGVPGIVYETSFYGYSAEKIRPAIFANQHKVLLGAPLVMQKHYGDPELLLSKIERGITQELMPGVQKTVSALKFLKEYEITHVSESFDNAFALSALPRKGYATTRARWDKVVQMSDFLTITAYTLLDELLNAIDEDISTDLQAEQGQAILNTIVKKIAEVDSEVNIKEKKDKILKRQRQAKRDERDANLSWLAINEEVEG